MPKRRPAWDRFWEKVDFNGPAPEYRPDLGPCWLWTAQTNQAGYGRFHVSRSGPGPITHQAHRVAYRWLIGEPPKGLVLDHLCRVRNCVNPRHLEPVTDHENSLRGVNPKMVAHLEDRCTRGHPFDGANTLWRKNGYRECRACRKEAKRRWMDRQKASSA
jgi:hypothetical protein